MSLRKRVESVVVFALAMLALCVLLPLIALVFAAAFLWWKPRIPVVIALALMVVTAITVVAGEKGIGEDVSVWAYLLLAAGVVLMLIKYIVEGRGDVEEEEDKP